MSFPIFHEPHILVVYKTHSDRLGKEFVFKYAGELERLNNVAIAFEDKTLDKEWKEQSKARKYCNELKEKYKDYDYDKMVKELVEQFSKWIGGKHENP